MEEDGKSEEVENGGREGRRSKIPRKQRKRQSKHILSICIT